MAMTYQEMHTVYTGAPSSGHDPCLYSNLKYKYVMDSNTIKKQFGWHNIRAMTPADKPSKQAIFVP